VKFNDLKAQVSHKISGDILPFDVRTDFIRVTEDSVLTPVTVQIANRDLEFQNKDGVMHATLDVFGQLSTLSGRIVNTFEKGIRLDVPEGEFQKYAERKSVYQEVVPLRPGRYKLSMVLKDDSNNRMGSLDLPVTVPHYDDDSLSYSSLILADLIQPLPMHQVGSGPFVIGSTKVRPSVNGNFTRDQSLGIYMQVYNLSVDPKTHKPSADIEYDITKDGQPIWKTTQEAANVKNASQQLTIEQQLPLKPLQPGRYTLAIKVTDNIRKQSVSPTASFEVR
jgi:hypothetical protein